MSTLQGYLAPVRRLVLRAQAVVDDFHAIRLASHRVTEVRQRTQHLLRERERVTGRVSD